MARGEKKKVRAFVMLKRTKVSHTCFKRRPKFDGNIGSAGFVRKWKKSEGC